MFCNYGHPLVPGIASLDNFYAKQHEDGEICREINRTTGRDFTQWVNRQRKDLFSRWGRFSVRYVGREVPQPPPQLTLDALNHPILAWAELERYGKHDLAREIALEHLGKVAEVFRATGTVWENYAPDAAAPGKPSKRDFVGWTGIVPILYFIEYRIGLKPDAPNNRLTWTLTSDKRCGCERFRFGGHTATLVAEPGDAQPQNLRLTVQSDGAFALRVERKGKQWDLVVEKGRNEFVLK